MTVLGMIQHGAKQLMVLNVNHAVCLGSDKTMADRGHAQEGTTNKKGPRTGRGHGQKGATGRKGPQTGRGHGQEETTDR